MTSFPGAQGAVKDWVGAKGVGTSFSTSHSVYNIL